MSSQRRCSVHRRTQATLEVDQLCGLCPQLRCDVLVVARVGRAHLATAGAVSVASATTPRHLTRDRAHLFDQYGWKNLPPTRSRLGSDETYTEVYLRRLGQSALGVPGDVRGACGGAPTDTEDPGANDADERVARIAEDIRRDEACAHR